MKIKIQSFTAFIVSITPLLFLTFILGGCTSSKSRVGGILNLDTDLKLSFNVASDINPDADNHPSPLFVRFYQLKSPLNFEKLDFIDIYEHDQDIFGADIIGKQKLKPFAPGESREERFVLSSGVRYIAIYAEFSQYAGSSFKVIFPVTENNVIRNKEVIQISDRSLTLVKNK